MKLLFSSLKVPHVTEWLVGTSEKVYMKCDVILVSKVPNLLIFTGDGENVKDEESAKAVKWKKLITKVLKQVRKRKRRRRSTSQRAC